MALETGDKIRYKDGDAVITSVHDNGFDVAAATERTGGRCRVMHLDVQEEEIEPREE